MFKRKLSYLFLLLIFSGLLFPIYSAADDPGKPNKKVLVVHSYNPEYEWVSTISRGIKRVFEPHKDILVETFYMYTKNNASEERKEQAGNQVREIISKWDPDVVITVDDNAQEYVGKYYVGKERPMLVFCGVSTPIEEYGYPAAPNITGIMETSTLKKTITFLDERITPVKSISIIGNDSPISEGIINNVKGEIEALGKKVVSTSKAGTFNQWKSKISDYHLNNSDAILVTLYDSIRDEGSGDSILPKKIMEWTVANSSIPVIGITTDTVDDGALLGVIGSGLEHGRESALIALGLLNGKNISDYPVKTAKLSVVLLNINTAQKVGVTLDEELFHNVDVIVGY